MGRIFKGAFHIDDKMAVYSLSIKLQRGLILIVKEENSELNSNLKELH